MKKRNLLLPVLLILAIAFSSCNQKEEPKEEILGGEVSYKFCQHEEGISCKNLNDPTSPQGEAYLFKDSIPEQMRNQINNEINSPPYPEVFWIIYYSETANNAILFSEKNLYPSIINGKQLRRVTIRNFPDFAKEWENGCKVYFEGYLCYECVKCNPRIQLVILLEYVLTTLKTKRK